MNVLLVIPDRVGFPRIGVMYIVAMLHRHGHNVAIAHACDGLDILSRIISDFIPEVVGYSIMTGEHISVLAINRELKKRFSFLSVFGGPHPTFFPSLIDENGCDALCVGEGDIAFPEFIDRLQKRGEWWLTPNFIVRHEGKVYNNDPMDLVEDLDELADPERDLIFAQDDYLRNEPSKHFFATRGCPYKCTYCFNNKFNRLYHKKGRIIRNRSAQRVVDEIAAVKAKYPMTQAVFLDDSFLTQPQQWFDDFSRLYKERIDVPFTINVRANLVRHDVLAKLKGAGLCLVWMGVECGDERLANELLGRQLSNKQIVDAVHIIQGLGIKLITQNLTGLPVPNSFDVDLKTLDFNILLKPDFAWSSILYPYPGTPIAEYAKLHGYIKEGNVSYAETNKRFSSFSFSPKEKRRIENLHKLFGVLVQFSWLRPLAKVLASLPFSSLYLLVFYSWYGWCLKIKTRSDINIMTELMRNIALLFKMLKKG